MAKVKKKKAGKVGRPSGSGLYGEAIRVMVEKRTVDRAKALKDRRGALSVSQVFRDLINDGLDREGV